MCAGRIICRHRIFSFKQEEEILIERLEVEVTSSSFFRTFIRTVVRVDPILEMVILRKYWNENSPLRAWRGRPGCLQGVRLSRKFSYRRVLQPEIMDEVIQIITHTNLECQGWICRVSRVYILPCKVWGWEISCGPVSVFSATPSHCLWSGPGSASQTLFHSPRQPAQSDRTGFPKNKNSKDLTLILYLWSVLGGDTLY